jgi:hypothetical protein
MASNAGIRAMRQLERGGRVDRLREVASADGTDAPQLASPDAPSPSPSICPFAFGLANLAATLSTDIPRMATRECLPLFEHAWQRSSNATAATDRQSGGWSGKSE